MYINKSDRKILLVALQYYIDKQSDIELGWNIPKIKYIDLLDLLTKIKKELK